MSLFIGNLSKSVVSSDLEKVFGEYGSCRINYKGSFAFAEFDHEKDAEDALDNLQSKDMGGKRINIEWSKKSRRFDEGKSNRKRRSISSRRKDGRCYNCGSRGHYLRDCTRKKRHSRSRSRSRSRRRRSTSRDRDRRHRRKRSYSRSSRSRSHSYKKRGRRNSSSSSSSRSRKKSESSRDRSPYEKKHRSDDKKERNTSGNGSNSNKEKEEINHANHSNHRRSRSSSRSYKNSLEKKNNKSEAYSSNLGQILDKDMISDKYKENNHDKEKINRFSQENGEDNVNNFKDYMQRDEIINDGKNNCSTNDNTDYSKFRNDDLKNELKKRNINYSKTAKKNELIDLLTKSDVENK